MPKMYHQPTAAEQAGLDEAVRLATYITAASDQDWPDVFISLQQQSDYDLFRAMLTTLSWYRPQHAKLADAAFQRLDEAAKRCAVCDKGDSETDEADDHTSGFSRYTAQDMPLYHEWLGKALQSVRD